MSPEETKKIEDQVHKRVDDHVHNDRIRWLVLAWSVIALFIVMTVLSIAFAILLKKSNDTLAKVEANTRSIQKVDSDTTTQQRNTSYRVCARESVDRAFAQSFSLDEPKTLRKLQLTLPILDCTPNIKGRPAITLSPKEQEEFTRRWAKGQLTNEEMGICSVPPKENVC